MMPRAMIGKWNVLASGMYVACLMSAAYGAVYYLPLYFQSVNDASAILSAVYLLPMIISQLISAGIAGAAGKSDEHQPESYAGADMTPSVSKIGYVIPVSIFSTIFLPIGTGLYSLLQPGTSSGQWIGFQIVGGVGFGAGLQLVHPLRQRSSTTGC